MTKQHNREMNLAWQYIEGTNVSVFLTGKAGTGKTTFLRRIRELSPKRMVVVAPTGVAAINAQGVTIHSFFQLPLGVHIPGTTYKEGGNHYQLSQEKKNIMRTMDLLVIDEISMVRADLLDAIDTVLRKYKDRYRPFGGVQLLLIGDLQQLAPVAVEKEWNMLKDYYQTPFFFSSHALQQVRFVTIELQHIYRQQDERFISLLGKIRNGQLDAATIQALNTRYIPNYEPKDDEQCIRLTTHNYMAQRVNDSKLAALPSREYKFEAVVDGDFPESSYPADAILTLKVGAQVMFIRNAADQSYYNGKVGKVVGFAEDVVLVECSDDTTPIHVMPVTWENNRMRINEQTKEIEEETIGTFQQYPLRLAWAITIHKSQGLTFDHAILDVNDSFAHGQVYVAMSRCRTLEGMVLNRPLDIRSLMEDRSVNDFITHELANSADAPAQLGIYRQEFYKVLLEELFTFTQLRIELNYVVRVLEEHLAKQQPELTQAWKEAAQQFEENVYKVSMKFHVQLQRTMADPSSAPVLNERIQKGTAYFVEQLYLLDDLNEQTKPEIGNKTVKKQFQNAIDTFRLDFQTKTLTLELVGEHGFSVKTYLRDKANALLTDFAAERKRKKKAKKEPKEKTQAVSLRLFREGKSVDEIAKERNLTSNTIFGHLAGFVEAGEVEVHDLVSDAHLTLVRETLNKHGWPENDYKLFNAQPTLSRQMSFNEFRFILHLLKEEK